MNTENTEIVDTQEKLVEQIGSVLEDGHFSGLFSQVGERAMSIATNEIRRLQSVVSMARIRDLARRG